MRDGDRASCHTLSSKSFTNMASKASKALLTHTRRWLLIDAARQPVGRIASQVATLLQGKNKPIYHPTYIPGDNVVIINAEKVQFTGKKWKQKLYRWHTQWPGGFREETPEHLHQRKPTEVLRKAIDGMLPRNKLRKRMMEHLHLVEGTDHPYTANIAAVIEPEHEPVPQLPTMFVATRVAHPDDDVPEGIELVQEIDLAELATQSDQPVSAHDELEKARSRSEN
eukprot:TRINITY_DN9158_c0_g1_i2.p1 TRINITY_DN9158_c0_g1~~TRINITY_DN9158_c0_g1_i2.p1  ORF type:complete len:225 (+),score=24.82 TRINITY_DN9158_c0_g1_i2:247-921(+)